MNCTRLLRWCGAAMLLAAGFMPLAAENDAAYTAKILEYTTMKCFLTDMVDHLPASATVPTPQKILGHIVGAPDILDYSKDIYRYFDALDQASDRVTVFRVGKSDQGKDMLLVAVSDVENLRRADDIRQTMARLADPRKVAAGEAEAMIKGGIPVYWVTGGLHSQESGSPEMLMELAYRLAVDEGEKIRAIRRNSLVLITPILEVDGWDRAADVYRYKKDNQGKKPMWQPYWGDYVHHDNNRDSIALALKLSRQVYDVFFRWFPVVMHDLHESIPYLYISTGTGPHNAWLDPITINEWEELGAVEVNELTRQGVPGVWKHGFWDGWAPGYVEYAAMFHNSVGRFYETFGGIGADTQVRFTVNQAKRAWYRPNPPFADVKWSFRNNINLQQSGVLVGLYHVAQNHEKFLRQFYQKGLRAIAKARSEGPAAYVIPDEGRRPQAAARLVNLLRRQGVEVQRAEKAIDLGKEKYPAGSYVIRMDQPYSRCADMLLDLQYYNPKDPRPYDDTGWTLGPLFHVKTVRVTDTKILDQPMQPLTGDAVVKGGIRDAAEAVAFLIDYNAEPEVASLRYRLPKLRMLAAEKAFMAGESRANAGSLLIPRQGNPADLERQLGPVLEKLGLTARGLTEIPEIPTHAVSAPRVAIAHSWLYTQDDGWYRLAFENLGIPFSYIALQDIRDTADLKSKYDVILLPPMSLFGTVQRLVNGISAAVPIPWKKSERYPNMGTPAGRDDIRGGIEMSGIVNLKRFIEQGGLLIPIAGSCALPIDYGLSEAVIQRQSPKLKAMGTILNTTVADPFSPIIYGYEREKPLGVYFSGKNYLETGVNAILGDMDMADMDFGAVQGKPSGRGTAKDPDVVQGRPAPDKNRETGTGFDDQTREILPLITPPQLNTLRIPLRFDSADKVLYSGLLEGAEEIANRPAVVDVPSGRGHVVLFAIHPMWRMETWSNFALLFNAILHYDHLDAGRPAAPGK